MTSPAPGGRDIRLPVIALLVRAYELGPDSPELPVWPEGPNDEPWTQAEAVAAFQFAAATLLNLAWEADASGREGCPVDVAEFLATRQLMITLAQLGDPSEVLARIARDGYEGWKAAATGTPDGS